MRTTVTLAEDVAAAIEQHRRQSSKGISESINDLVRAGLHRAPSGSAFRQTTHDLGKGLDYTNIADALETLDGPASP